MRLGGPLFAAADGPEGWAAAVCRAGYRAAYCPVGADAPDDLVRAYAAAAREADLVIAEVGAWSNPLSRDEAERQAALDKCRRALDLADRIGARCCVNIVGSLGAKWDGPCAADLTDEAFGLVVESVRAIVDAVRPTRSFYTLETMPWMLPDSPASYLRLLEAIDRPSVAVHFDPVNLVNCPSRYFATGALIREFVDTLGPRIRSCHAKDIKLGDRLTLHLDEVRPGVGGLDYPAFLHAVNALDPDTPVMLEHLPSEAEYTAAAEHLRAVAAREGVAL